MKTRRTIYIVLGCILAALNLLIFIAALPGNDIPPEYKGDTAYEVGHYFGKSLFFILAIILFFSAHRVTRKIREKERQQLLDSFNDPS